MNLVLSSNNRTLIFLKQENGYVLATLTMLVELPSGRTEKRVLGTRKITEAQKNDLISQRQTLEAKNIFIIDGTEAQTALLETVTSAPLVTCEELIPSPFVLELFSQELLLATQKTRGPNN
jgi:hypothetical protein